MDYKLNGCGYSRCSPCRVKGYEATEINYVCNYLDRLQEAGKLKGVFVDVGAHVGLWAMSMSEWYQNRYNQVPVIYALEPDELNYRKLRLNATQPQTGITAVQLAAWNKDETLVLKRNSNPGRHKVIGAEFAQPNEKRIQAVRLDSIASQPEQRQADAIKIDVEGAELMVLQGARRFLIENDNLLVVIEYSVGHFHEYGYTTGHVTRFMEEHGFRPARAVDKKVTNKICSGEIKRVIFVKGDIN